MRKLFPAVSPLILLMLLLFFCGLTPGVQAQNAVSLNVRGIGIGATYPQVTRRFGKPMSSSEGGENPCGGKKLVLRYPGLVFTLDGETSLRYFTVVAIEVTSPKYPVASTIGVGASLAKVRSKLGRKNELTKEAGGQKLSYPVRDGFADFHFRKNKLVKTVWEMNLC
ncbi:MAG: hypothetical protein M3384_11440 [Acidobacteriota bacterium]|nr:hypothetical protein [Acidobacteriota bacterium]